jgi:hypothetical protein
MVDRVGKTCYTVGILKNLGIIIDGKQEPAGTRPSGSFIPRASWGHLALATRSDLSAKER